LIRGSQNKERSMTELRERFFASQHPPRVEWPGGGRVAVQIVVNYEEGSEKSFSMGDGDNDQFPTRGGTTGWASLL
jgi:hypothetical protein